MFDVSLDGEILGVQPQLRDTQPLEANGAQDSGATSRVTEAMAN